VTVNIEMTAKDRASQFVNQILEEFANIKVQNAAVPIQAFEKKELCSMTLKLLERQASFLASNVDSTVDIGYHYTFSTYLKQIRTHGLLTEIERKQRGIMIGGGGIFGDGIYTADNPFAFSNYGSDICLICVRLRGTVKCVTQGRLTKDAAIHCVIGNKMLSLPSDSSKTHYANEVVLQSSSQIIPVLQVAKEVITKMGIPPYANWQDAQITSIMNKYIAALQKPSWIHFRR
jgi:hypothetical protein